MTAVLLLGLAACSSDNNSAATTTSVATTTTVAETTTSSVAPTTTVAETTTAPATVPPTAAPTTTTASACSGPAAVPGPATNVVTISGDIDGDVVDDTVTSYTSGGVPHVHADTSGGVSSDVELPLGFAETVSIGFEDIDHALGAPQPPPFVVLAIGAGNAGSAFGAFLSLDANGCLGQWTLNSSPFSFRISQQGPFTGLTCDGAAGSIHYSLVSAEQQPDSSWNVSTQELTHDLLVATLTPLPDFTVPDSPDIAAQFGDIDNCTTAPLFG